MPHTTLHTHTHTHAHNHALFHSPSLFVALSRFTLSHVRALSAQSSHAQNPLPIYHSISTEKCSSVFTTLLAHSHTHSHRERQLHSVRNSLRIKCIPEQSCLRLRLRFGYVFGFGCGSTATAAALAVAATVAAAEAAAYPYRVFISMKL